MVGERRRVLITVLQSEGESLWPRFEVVMIKGQLYLDSSSPVSKNFTLARSVTDTQTNNNTHVKKSAIMKFSLNFETCHFISGII